MKINWVYSLIRWAISAIALAIAAWIFPGITVGSNGVIAVLGMALILGFLNAFIRPILAFLGCGCMVATLGLFIFVINALVFLLASQVSQAIGIVYEVKDFWTALGASIVASLISFVANWFIRDPHS